MRDDAFTSGSGRNPTQRGRRARVAIGALCLVGAGASLTVGLGSRSDADDARTSADEVRILEVRASLRGAHLAELNALMLLQFEVGSESDVATARAARESARREARTTLAGIADGDGAVSLEATSLLELLDGDQLDGVDEPDAMKLIETGSKSAHAYRPPDGSLDDGSLALYDLVLTGITGAGILNDAMDAAYVLESPEVDPTLVEYVSQSEPYIRSDGGYLGPERSAPLEGSYVYDPTASVAHPGVAEVERLVVESDLWTYDQWVRSWQEGTPSDAAPLDLSELASVGARLDGEIAAVIHAALDEELAVHDRAADAAGTRAAVLLVLGVLLVLVPLGLGVRAISRRLRHVTRAAAQATTDPLTGVGNRHQLKAETEAHTADPTHGWHLVAAIDMDRFKMINDTWGHAVGDRVLTEVAQRLTAIVAGWRGSAAGTNGTVVRMGGDEFLMTLHTPSPVNVDIIREQLDELRSTAIELSEPGTSVQLTFSFGIAVAAAPASLDDLIREADLLAYEEKARRAQDLPDRRRPPVSAEERTASADLGQR